MHSSMFQGNIRHHLGPDYMANFSPGRNFSSANRAEISSRLLKQILLKSNCRLHGEGFSPGRNSARARNPSGLGFSARPNGPEKLIKSHVIETELSELGHAQWFCFPGNEMVAARKEKRFQWNKGDMRKFFLQHQSGTSSPIIFCHHWSVRPFITQSDLRFLWAAVTTKNTTMLNRSATTKII